MRLMISMFLGALALAGCAVAAEPRMAPSSSPPPQQALTVTVAWNDARVVFLREYYGCDWDDAGMFDFYETRHGIPEDDLFVLFHISRHRNLNFHEVVFTYESCGRNIFQVTSRCGFPIWDLYVDIPRGTWCPPAYARAYGFYWNRDNRVILANYDIHALFWLRFSVNYYGWSHGDVFTRWERCVDSGDRFAVVVHREYQYAGRGNRNFRDRPVVRIAERPERGDEYRRIIQTRRVDGVKRVEVDVTVRVQKGQPVVRPPSKDVLKKKAEERRQEHDQERERERSREKKELDRTKHERPDRDKAPPSKDDRKDDKKDDGKKDDRRDPPPPPKNDKKDDRKDDKKDDGKKDDKKDDGKKNDKKDGKKDDEKNDKKDDR